MGHNKKISVSCQKTKSATVKVNFLFIAPCFDGASRTLAQFALGWRLGGDDGSHGAGDICEARGLWVYA